MRHRLPALIAVLILTLSLSGLAFAQTTDPNNPVAHPTATETGANPTDTGDNAEPTPTDNPFFDENDSEAASPEATATTEEPASGNPGPEASPTSMPGTLPQASPVAGGDAEVDLAAMTLDDSALTSDWILTGEQYISVQQLADALAGAVSVEELQATGMTGYYESYYANQAGNQVRTYVIAYDSPEGVQKGFDILENEDLLVPNGSMQDLPALSGVGETPAEITTGTVENGDGTQQATYDISFRIDRFEVGAAMETNDGSEPDRDLVQQMARDLADRVTAVLAGDKVEGVDYALPGETVTLDGQVAYEGYETAAEVFFAAATDITATGYVGGYYRAYTYSTDVSSYLPLITVGSASFENDNDVADLLNAPDNLMPAYDQLTPIDNFDAGDADQVVAFSFAAPNGPGQVDSVRAFVQVGSILFTVDVQGEKDVDSAQKLAEQIVARQLDCQNGGDCTVTINGNTF